MRKTGRPARDARPRRSGKAQALPRSEAQLLSTQWLGPCPSVRVKATAIQLGLLYVTLAEGREKKISTRRTEDAQNQFSSPLHPPMEAKKKFSATFTLLAEAEEIE